MTVEIKMMQLIQEARYTQPARPVPCVQPAPQPAHHVQPVLHSTSHVQPAHQTPFGHYQLQQPIGQRQEYVVRDDIYYTNL